MLLNAVKMTGIRTFTVSKLRFYQQEEIKPTPPSDFKEQKEIYYEYLLKYKFSTFWFII